MDLGELWILPLFVLLLLTLFVRKGLGRKVKRKLPPSPPAWPIIGHLHLLAKLPHQVMAQLAKRYGPIFYLRLGLNPALVISSPNMARHFLQLHDAAFSDRPPSEHHRRVLHSKSVVFMKYGPEWRDVRRICSTVVFHPKIWNSSEALRMEEVAAMLKAVAASQKQQPIGLNLARICHDFVSTTMTRLLFTDTRHVENIREVSQMTSDLFAIPVLGDFIPWLRCMDWRTKQEMDRVASQIDSMFGKLINERRNESCNRSSPDFLDALLSAQKDDRFPSYIDDQSVIQTCMDILSAGTETTSTVMEWTMAELLANPAQLKRLQEEIDQVVPSQRMVNSEDLQNMSYLKAVIKESLRLHPPFGLILRHASEEEEGEMEAGSYSVPPNCILFVNVWAMGRDPAFWDDPLRFYPPRFLSGQTTDTQESIVELSGHHFQLLPFGTGRRRCPGITIAMAMLELGLSNLVHAFDWKLPAGVLPEQLDMAERPSLSVSRLNPLLACAISRH